MIGFWPKLRVKQQTSSHIIALFLDGIGMCTTGFYAPLTRVHHLIDTEKLSLSSALRLILICYYVMRIHIKNHSIQAIFSSKCTRIKAFSANVRSSLFCGFAGDDSTCQIAPFSHLKF